VSRSSSHQRWNIRSSSNDDDHNDDNDTVRWFSPSSKNLELAVATAASALTIPASAIVLWSEWAIFWTGCGPVHLSDALERGSYLTVIATSSLFWLTRLVTLGQMNLADVFTVELRAAEGAAADTNNDTQRKQASIRLRMIRWAELVNALAVFGAFVTLGLQINRDTRMDGLTGINVDMCRAARDLL